MSQDSTTGDSSLPITWQTRIPMLSSKVIIRQLFFVLFASSACFLIFMLLLELIDGQLTLVSAGQFFLMTLAILFGLFILAVISILVVYQNRYEVQFTVNETGVRSTTIGRTKRRNALINTLLLFSGKPGPVGAGLMAASRQSELVRWENIDNFIVNPDTHEIQLRKGKSVLMLVPCNPDNYEAVLERVEDTLS